MRRIIWGIGAVLCVQIAFQLAMMADRSNNDYAALRTPLENGIDTSLPALDADALDTNIAPAKPESEIARSQIQTRVLIRYVLGHESPPQATPTTTAFKPVVITYDRRGALTGGPNTTAERRLTEKPKPQPDNNRSLLAKVITKPYDWLKFVGSKLH